MSESMRESCVYCGAEIWYGPGDKLVKCVSCGKVFSVAKFRSEQAKVRAALKAGAEEIIVAHNHPSGDLTPSKADVDATKKLREAAQLLGVKFLDHLIVGTPDSSDGTDFTSLAEMQG